MDSETDYWRVQAQDAIAELHALEARLSELLAERDALRKALSAIDHHRGGACDYGSGMPDPCEECVEMRELAEEGLRNADAARKGQVAS